MSPNDQPELTAASLLALRQDPDALKTITSRLRVKEMGPADHIRTKHEVKAFLESAGSPAEAEAIVTRARSRREIQQAHEVAEKLNERQSRGQSQQP